MRTAPRWRGHSPGSAHLDADLVQHLASGVGDLHHVPPRPGQPGHACATPERLAIHAPQQPVARGGELQALARRGDVGVQRNVTENSSISMRASQNSGVDWPIVAAVRMTASIQLLRVTAAAMPIGRPIRAAKAMDVTAR